MGRDGERAERPETLFLEWTVRVQFSWTMFEEAVPELLAFFKALADATRLKIVGLLARQPHTVKQIAAILNLHPSTAYIWPVLQMRVS